MRMIQLFIFSLILFGCTKEKSNSDSVSGHKKEQIKSIISSDYSAFNILGIVIKGSFEGKSTFKYDNKGNQTEQLHFNPEGSMTKWTYWYDDKGNLAEMTDEHEERRLRNRTTYQYDGKGNKNEENLYVTDGSLKTKTTYKYDDKGIIARERRTFPYDVRNGDSYFKWTYKYDDKGNMTECNNYEADTLISKDTYEYDGYGKLTEHIYSRDGSLKTKTTYKYDDNGNEIEVKRYDRNGILETKFTTKYNDYDKEGNWLRMIVFEDDKPVIITTREIEYY